MKTKKTFLILGLMATSLIIAIAQQKVVNTGQTYMGTSTPTTAATLSLDHNDGYNYYQYSFGVPVSIESGSTVIHSGNVTIKNDFEIKTGASFEIR